MEEDPPEHNWKHRGINIPREKDSKWEVWLRILLSFLLGGLSAAFFVGGKSRDVNDLLIWKGEVSTILQRMDRDGTNRSHWVDEEQSKQIATNQFLIKEVQAKAEARGEIINVIQGKIERMEGEIKDLKDRGKQ